jgi:hypothetical protein
VPSNLPGARFGATGSHHRDDSGSVRMKGAIMQPYFFPYIGYYQLVYEVKKFIFLDNVNYIKKGFINRNSILLNGARYDFAIPVLKVSQNRTINQHEYAGDFNVFLNSIKHGYKKARNFEVAMSLIESVVSDRDNNVARKNARSVMQVFDYLGILRNFSFSSTDEMDEALKGSDRILAISGKHGIDQYRNAIGGQNLYNHEEFKAAGIELKFIKSKILPYPQGNHEFIPGLSMIDLLMNCDKEHIVSMLSEYTLV